MKLRLLIACAIAATFIAGCSGGGGGSSSILQSSGSGSSMPTQSVSITLDRSSVGSSSLKRNAKFVAASVNDVSYAFVNGSNVTVASGDVALSGSNCVNNVCTISISAPVGTYTLNLTLKDSGIAVGSGSSSITVSLGGTNSAAVTINPILTGGSAGPSITVPTTGSVFFVDTEATQTVAATVNELDPVGDIICGTTKSVQNWPGITVSASGSTSGVSIPSPTVSTPPGCPGGSGNVAIDYQKTQPLSVVVGHSHALSVALGSSVMITASDGTSSNSVTIPFVSLSNSQTSVLDIIDASTVNNVTITEANGFYASETGFGVTGCGIGGEAPDVTMGSANSFSKGSSSSPNSTQTLTVTGAVTALDSSCTLTIASNVHPALTTSISLSIAPSVGVTISGKMRSGNAR